AHAEPTGARITVLHGELDVGNARSLVLEDQTHPAPAAGDNGFDARKPTPSVVYGVTGNLASRGHELGLIDQAEPYGRRSHANLLTYPDYVFGRAHLERVSALHLHLLLPRHQSAD